MHRIVSNGIVLVCTCCTSVNLNFRGVTSASYENATNWANDIQHCCEHSEIFHILYAAKYV